MPTPTKTKRPAQSQANPTTTNKGNAAELFERGHALIHGAKPGPIAELPASRPANRFAKIIEAVRQSGRDNLEGHFESFVKEASPEEIHIMNRILMNWDQYSHSGLHGEADSPVSREVPILCAFQEEVDGDKLVAVPNEEMVPYVESFIVELGERWYKVEEAKKRSRASGDDHAIEYLRKEIAVFVQDAGEQSITFMGKLLARWSQLHRDPAVRAAVEGDGNANLLMSAAEIEAGRLGASQSVQIAIHTS